MVITDELSEPPTESELIARARAGDAGAFCRLIEPLQARLFRQAAALSGNMAMAEDLVSEVRIRAWKSLGRYSQTCRFSTWLYAILLHCHQEAVRRARSRPISLARLPFSEANELAQRHENHPSSAPSPAANAILNDAAVQLRRCLARLSEKHREVIQLRFFEDASLPDIAAVLGCSIGTAKSRLHHALEKLRQMKMNLPDTRGNEQL
jgi:RNA polymerase sigma-70 factor (ECF subfamily)